MDRRHVDGASAGRRADDHADGHVDAAGEMEAVRGGSDGHCQGDPPRAPVAGPPFSRGERSAHTEQMADASTITGGSVLPETWDIASGGWRETDEERSSGEFEGIVVVAGRGAHSRAAGVTLDTGN
jgi:hypothetical protein